MICELPLPAAEVAARARRRRAARWVSSAQRRYPHDWAASIAPHLLDHLMIDRRGGTADCARCI